MAIIYQRNGWVYCSMDEEILICWFGNLLIWQCLVWGKYLLIWQFVNALPTTPIILRAMYKSLPSLQDTKLSGWGTRSHLLTEPICIVELHSWGLRVPQPDTKLPQWRAFFVKNWIMIYYKTKKHPLYSRCFLFINSLIPLAINRLLLHLINQNSHINHTLPANTLTDKWINELVLFIKEHKLVIKHIQLYLTVFINFTCEDLFRKLVQDLFLDHPFQRASAVLRIVTQLGQPV